jgi:hypothetical protein
MCWAKAESMSLPANFGSYNADSPGNSPYPIFAKRLAYKTHFYEIFNQPNITLIDLQSDPTHELTPSGLLSEFALDRPQRPHPRDGLQHHPGRPRRHLYHRPRHVHYARAVLEERKVILPQPFFRRVPKPLLCLWPAVSNSLVQWPSLCAVLGRLDLSRPHLHA